MNHYQLNRGLAGVVIFGAVAASLVGATPTHSADPGTQFSSPGMFDMSGQHGDTLPYDEVVASVDAILDEATSSATSFLERVEKKDLGRATAPNEAMTTTQASLAEAINSLDAETVTADTENLLFSAPTFVRASTTSSSTEVKTHVLAEVAETHISNVEAIVSEWEASVEEAFAAWDEAIAAENARLEEEERIRAAEEEARRQAEARAAAQASAQAAQAAQASRSNQGNRSSTAPTTTAGGGSNVAPARASGESASQRVNRLMGRLGVSVPYSFTECNIARAMGCYITGQSSIRITSLGLSKDDRTMCRIILHEYRHVQQFQQGLIEFGPTSVLNAPWLESDANNYAASRNNC